ncbi:MAG: protein kinase, partial [candidate division Zixibacteria bacterium]|nr:protein kinase [candidate division Zixibacteria bacterium]
MDTNRWKRVQELFDAVIDLPADERAAFLERKCAGDDELRAEVESLLDADASDHAILDGHAADMIGVEEAPSREGTAVGPYRLVEEIGAGGMGTVYLAERADGQFRQKVALKVIRRGMDTEQILQRFAGERQILARLQHPNIARLFDGGMTDDGVPYFTMEYIDGEPIDLYCDKRRLSIDDRLQLFLTVCDAVDYAHHNLVVHRDLKPGNMLIAVDGTVKLLDFGIAKVIGRVEDATQLESITRTGARVMTPGYASPEQIRGDTVTTSTDVYSLGVVLYKLLTGLRPYAMTGDNPLEAERAVLLTDPNRPSAAVIAPPEFTGADDTEVSTARLADARGTTPERLRKRLAGDLDNISLMALRKEPDRRYASAGHLRDEIRRHLNGLPVEARPDTIGYRVSKFAKRYRGAVITGAAVLVMLVGVVTYYTIRLANERDRARASAERAETASRFLRGMFELPSTGTIGGRVTVRELLENGAARIETEFAGQPDMQANMYAVLGDLSVKVGMFESALDLLARSIELKRELYDDPHPDIAATIYMAAVAAYEIREFGAAETLYNEVLTIQRMMEPNDDSAVAGILNDLGALWR